MNDYVERARRNACPNHPAYGADNCPGHHFDGCPVCGRMVVDPNHCPYKH